ncbi:unnamed protein product, partial [Dracunculus medinensis]|uniref:LIM zinc-binding domain-containing protein n=1 Tax=Dracunculus medinensis TaxID=318479 RepID=A0A0N4U466_DRAME
CKGSLTEGNLVIYAERFEDDVHWHPQCFICTECSNILVDLIYFKHGADIFCGRHHAEKFKPRCAKCDELIFSEECTEAEGRTWHMSHFSCVECGTQLGGQKYIAKNERTLCVPCYHRNFSLACNTCRETINVEKPHITQISFDSNISTDCAHRRNSVPRPPLRNPPTPPNENIYETVLPFFSYNRRSHSADMRHSQTDKCKNCIKKADADLKRQNYYSRMPPSPSYRRRHRRCSSCSSSESDGEDIYLSKYLAVSLARYENMRDIKHEQKNQRNAVLNRMKASKNKSNNCIVS